MNDTQFLSELKRRLISKNVDADSADKYAEQFKRYFDNLPEDEIEEQVLSLGNMDSIVDNLVSLINAKKARSAQGGQKDKTGAERENSGADKAYRADRREKTDNTDNRSKADSSAMNTEAENGAKAENETASAPNFSAGTETETELKAVNETDTETASASKFSAGTETETELKAVNETDTETASASKFSAGTETEIELKAVSEAETDIASVSKFSVGTETETELKAVNETDTETASASKFSAGTETETELKAGNETETEAASASKFSEGAETESEVGTESEPETKTDTVPESMNSGGGVSAENGADQSSGTGRTARADMSPELPDESDIFCGDTNDKNIYADGCDPEKELTMLHGGAVRETAPARRNVPVRGRGQRRSYGYYDSEGFSREAYNAAYMDSNSEAEFVISSEAPTAEASLYMRRERVPVQGHGYYDYGYEPEEEVSGIRRYIYPQTRRKWLPLTSEAGRNRFRKIGICSLPLVLIAGVIGAALFAAAFAVLAAAIAAMLVLLIAVTVVGTAYSLISIVYGITQLFSVAPIGLYEIGIGIASVGLTMIAGIAVYNAAVRYMPYSIKYLLLFFTYVIDRAKGIVYDFREECANLK